MSMTITSPQFSADAANTADSARSAQPALTRSGAAAMVLAPLLMFVGSAIHPAEDEEGAAQAAIIQAASGRWLTAHIMLLLGTGLFVAAAFALTRPLRPASPRTAVVTTSVAIVGALGMFGAFTTEGLASWAVSRAGGGTDVAGALDQLRDVAMPFAIVGLLLIVALAATGVALWRSGSAPRLQAGGLVVGALLLFAALVGEIDVFGFAGMGLLVIAMWTLAYRDFTARR